MPAEAEADQAADETPDADRKANGHEGMPSDLQRRQVRAPDSTERGKERRKAEHEGEPVNISRSPQPISWSLRSSGPLVTLTGTPLECMVISTSVPQAARDENCGNSPSLVDFFAVVRTPMTNSPRVDGRQASPTHYTCRALLTDRLASSGDRSRNLRVARVVPVCPSQWAQRMHTRRPGVWGSLSWRGRCGWLRTVAETLAWACDPPLRWVPRRGAV